MSDFGEPWELDRCGILRDVRGHQPILFNNQLARARDCVNHMAGRDPAKLKKLLEAVRDVIAGQDLPLRLPGRIDDLDAALAAFEGKGAENGQ